jgi:hypothetical protein
MSATKHAHDRPAADASPAPDYRAPVVAALLGVDRDGAVRVSVPGHGEARARVLSTVTRAELQRASAGRPVVVLCEGADPSRPIVTGLLEDPVEALLSQSAQEEHLVEATERDRVFRAEGSITLVCGEASLTLHADGRVVTRGVNVVSVASEQQRIQGSVVRIN